MEFLPIKPKPNHLHVLIFLATCLFGASGCNHQNPEPTANQGADAAHYQKWADPKLDSLTDLSIEALRKRSYGSLLTIESILDSKDEASAYNTYMTSYDSDGLRVYSRLDIPASPPPTGGYPVMILIHGWVGTKDAASFDFGYKADSLYSGYIDAYVDAGFMVLTPGWRGHGTINGKQAEGFEFMQTWDNGSYISPIFYAIDVLNLIDGIQTIKDLDWQQWQTAERSTPFADTSRIHINGYSQGGDSALTVMAVSGEGSKLNNAVYSGSLWSGCFGTRFAQAGIYGPMATTLEAFMSGDGTWTGTATGKDGRINPNFVFAWPSDWIGSLDTHSPEWTWQADNWKLETVAESLSIKFTEMYNAVNQNIADINDATFSIETNEYGKTIIKHDPRIADAMYRISAYNYEQFLTEPLLFHHSDQDYYSIPEWNAELSARINDIGGSSVDYTYPGNTHSLTVSKHEWFSKEGTTEGLSLMITRDIELTNPVHNRPETTQ